MIASATAITRQPMVMAITACSTVSSPIRPAPMEKVPMDTQPPMKLAA